MEKLKYELTEEEVDFIIKALNEVPVKGLSAMNYMMQIVNKLQNPLNKKPVEPAIDPERLKHQMELLKKEAEKVKPKEPELETKKQG